MNSGFPERVTERSVMRCQSFSSMRPPRIFCSGTDDSALRIFITISVRLISREKNTVARSLWMAAARQTSRAKVDFPTPGRAATMTIWPGWRPLVRVSSSVKPVGTPDSASPEFAMASISSKVGSMSSLSDL